MCARGIVHRSVHVAVAGTGAQFQSAVAEVEVQEDGTVDCAFHLRRFEAGHSKLLVVVCENSKCLAATTTAAGLLAEHTLPRRRKLLLLEVPERAAVLDVLLRAAWPHSSGKPRYALSVIDHLPRPLPATWADGGSRELERFIVSVPQASGLTVAGAFATELDYERNTPMHAMIAPGSVEIVSSVCSLLLSDRFVAATSATDRARIRSLYGRLHEVIGHYFGRTAPVRTIIAVPGESGMVTSLFENASGMVLEATPDQFGIGTTDSPDDLGLGFSVAGAWWGGVARIHGPGAREFLVALRMSAALRWVEFARDASARAQMIDNLRASESRRSFVGRLLYRAENQLDPARVADLMFRLEERARVEASWPNALQEFTRSCWGKSVSVADAEAWLQSSS